MAQVIKQGETFQCPRQIWDHTVVAAGSAPLANVPLFSVPIGGTGYGVTNKTKYDTNLLQGNRINPGEAFILMQFGFSFFNVTLADQITFMAQYYFELSIITQGAVFADGQVWLYPLGTGIGGATAKTNEGYWNVGIPNLMVARAWGIENAIDIVDQTYFGVNMISPTTPNNMSAGGNGLDLQCVLDGLKQSLVHG
jgi:hypothetical protein